MSALDWQKSSFSDHSGGGDCLELAPSGRHAIRLRESDDPATVLNVSPRVCGALFVHIRAGRLSRIVPSAEAPPQSAMDEVLDEARARLTRPLSMDDILAMQHEGRGE
jgi:hypothetical protein